MQRERESTGNVGPLGMRRATHAAACVRTLLIMTAVGCAACSSGGKPRSADAVRKDIVAAEMRMYQAAPQGASDGQDMHAGSTSMRTVSRADNAGGVVDIFAPDPVGALELVAPAGGWPPALQLRFHHLKTMQAFTARSRIAQLSCELATPEMKDAPHLCTLGGNAVDALTRTSDGFEVRLPSVLLSAEDRTLEVRWVERYR